MDFPKSLRSDRYAFEDLGDDRIFPFGDMFQSKLDP